MSVSAILHAPALLIRVACLAASPALCLPGLPSLAPHLCPLFADVWAVRKRGGMHTSLKTGVKCLQLPWRLRYPEFAHYAVGDLLCPENKIIEHGYETLQSGNGLDRMLAHNRHRVEAGLTCQDERAAVVTNPKFSAASCSYGADSALIACLFAHSDPGEFRPRPVLTNLDSASFPITVGQQVSTPATPHDPAPPTSFRLVPGAAVPAVGRAVLPDLAAFAGQASL